MKLTMTYDNGTEMAQQKKTLNWRTPKEVFEEFILKKMDKVFIN